MDSKEVKDSGLYDDVHVGQPDYPDYADANVESYDGEHVNTGHTALKRQLKSRHIAMISIGGVIGTGLFLGTANSLKNGGPLGLLMGYLAIGSVCYCVMVSSRLRKTFHDNV
jgi:amino acid transporter